MTGSFQGSPPQVPFEPRHHATAANFPGSFSGAESRQSILDDEHLRLLRIGYFISAAQTAVLIPFGLLYALMGVVFSRLPGGAGAPPFMSWFFGIFGGVFAGIGLVTAALKLFAAIRLKERRSRTLCLVAAGLSCLEIPYGTALGIFTFVVLGRPSVRQAFEERR